MAEQTIGDRDQGIKGNQEKEELSVERTRTLEEDLRIESTCVLVLILLQSVVTDSKVRLMSIKTKELMEVKMIRNEFHIIFLNNFSFLPDLFDFFIFLVLQVLKLELFLV